MNWERNQQRLKWQEPFQQDDNDYIILKFKLDVLAKWQVGVVGFDQEGKECGYTFSEFEEYDETTAKDNCIAMIEH